MKYFPYLVFLVTLLCHKPMKLFAQVDLATGSAQANFPLYHYSTGGKVSASVSLIYKGGNGIKVSEIASNVGLGWGIQATGMISRSLRGEPDDQVGGTLNGDIIPTGRLFSPYANTNIPQKAGWIPLQDYKIPYYRGGAETVDDRESDIFTYSYNGRQGSFVIGIGGEIKVLDNSNLKIEKVEEDLSAINVLTRVSKFIITDESGVRYTFSEKERDRIILSQSGGQRRFYLDPPPANLITFACQQEFKVTNYSAVNNWYLSEILDPLTNKKITYTYEDHDLNYVAGIQGNYSISKIEDGTDQIVAQRMEPQYVGVAKRLVSIDLPDNNQVVFSYFATSRADFPGEKALQPIVIKKNGNTLFGYNFEYQYFCLTNIRDFNYGFTATEAANARLCLKSFRKFGINGITDNPYQFTYNTGTSTRGVPARNTPAVDHYGYYNGNTVYDWGTPQGTYNNVQNLCLPNQRVVIGTPSIMGAGMLTGIKYPTGGSLTYEYEGNWALDGTKNVRVGGLRVKSITASDGIGASPNIIKEYKYVLEDGVSSSGWGYEAPRYLDTTSSVLVIPTKGTYTAANLAYSLAMPAVSTFFQISALRSIAAAGVDKMAPCLVSDKVSMLTSTMVFTLIGVAVIWVVRDFFSPDAITIKLSSQSYSSGHPSNLNPLPSLYSRVEVYEGSSTENIGKTVCEFTSNKDFAVNYPYRNYLYSQKQRYFPGAYGLIKRQQVFNKNGEPVEEIYHKYNADIKVINNNLFKSTAYKANQLLISTGQEFTANPQYIGFDSEKYYPITGSISLAYTIEKKFDGSNCQIKRTDFEYDPKYYDLKKISILNSFNEKEEKRFYYPYDYNPTGVFKTMMDNHIYNIPISSETWVYRDGQEEKLAGAEITEFQQISSGDIKPAKTYLFASNAPVAKNVIGAFAPATLVRNTTYFKEAVTYSYNSAGYIATTSSSARLASCIYDDNNEMIIANVSNAGIADIGYSSFEPGAKGTWAVTAVGSNETSIANTMSPSGGYCLNMVAVKSVQKTGLDATKKYKLTFWKKDGNITVAGGVKIDEKNILIRNGWTLVSMYITQTTTVSLTGTGLMDELRLYPELCQLSSTTYDAQLNVITTMSPDNTAVYSDYDELGRIKNVYDADRNLVSSTEYKYAN